MAFIIIVNISTFCRTLHQVLVMQQCGRRLLCSRMSLLACQAFNDRVLLVAKHDG